MRETRRVTGQLVLGNNLGSITATELLSFFCEISVDLRTYVNISVIRPKWLQNT